MLSTIILFFAIALSIWTVYILGLTLICMSDNEYPNHILDKHLYSLLVFTILCSAIWSYFYYLLN